LSQITFVPGLVVGVERRQWDKEVAGLKCSSKDNIVNIPTFLYCVIVSCLIWSYWKKREDNIKRLLGKSMWYRTRYAFMPSWKFARQVKFFWSGKKCKRCGTRQRIDVHHTTYLLFGKPILYWEWLTPWSLRVLCRSCHDAEHFGT